MESSYHACTRHAWPPGRQYCSSVPDSSPLPLTVQGVVTYAPPVEAFATGIKIGSNDQRYFSDRSSDHSHFHERSRIKKARRDVTIRQRIRVRVRAYIRARAYRRGAYRGVPVLVNTRAAFHGANCTCTVATSQRRSLARKLGAGGRFLAHPSPRPQLPPGESPLDDGPN